MSQKYEVWYFPIKALAEPIRLLLSYGGQEFEDHRVSKEEWPQIKEKMPLGQMPVLKIGDKTLYQSPAICRYLARQYKLYGANDCEALEIDIAFETVQDLRLKMVPIHYEADEAIKNTKYAAQVENMNFLLKKLDEMVAKNNGYFAVSKLTWVDIWFTALYDYLCLICRIKIGDKYPNLKGVVDKVLALPAIKAWYEKAPACDF